jgi:hypothetical protein
MCDIENQEQLTMSSNSKTSSKKPVRPRSLKLNNQNKCKSISKRRQKATKHRTTMDTSIQADLLGNIQSQNSCTSNTGIEESQPSESITKDDSEGRLNLD